MEIPSAPNLKLSWFKHLHRIGWKRAKKEKKIARIFNNNGQNSLNALCRKVNQADLFDKIPSLAKRKSQWSHVKSRKAESQKLKCNSEKPKPKSQKLKVDSQNQNLEVKCQQ